MTTFKNETVTNEVLDILKRGSIVENRYYLPSGQLDRKTYVAVNEVLSRLGGKWKSGKVKAHVFEDVDPTALLELVQATGEMPPKNPTAFFATPMALAEEMLLHGTHRLPPDAKRVLEPSAGKGNIAELLSTCYPQHMIECCEILPAFRSILAHKGFALIDEPDFLAYEPGAVYDLIAMNPPFAVESDSLAYIAHISHAWNLLAPNGVLQAIAPSGFAFREDKRIKELRVLVESHGTWRNVEDGAFHESGTGVRTVMISMRK